MVLIDGEKLLDAVQGAINVMEAHGMNTVSATSLKAIIKCAPTVDAIPVEWLKDRVYEMKRAHLYRRYAEMLLMEWLQEQKEQEEKQ